MARAWIALAAGLILWRAIVVDALLYDEGGRPAVPVAEPRLEAGAGDRGVVESMLRENPANALAYLALAREEQAAGDESRAARAYAAAYEVAPTDRDVLVAAAAQLLSAGRASEALPLLGTAVENYADVREWGFAVMAQVLASGREAPAWNAIADRDPAWLGDFVTAACRKGVDPAVLAPVFLRRAAKRAARSDEAGCLVDRLRSAGRWDAAYQLWLDTLPRARLADVGFVFNGGFEYPATGIGFDWIPDTRLERDSGHSVEFARTPGAAGERALRVGYTGKRQSGSPIVQYLALAPGRYSLGGLARPERVSAGHGARWTVRCVGPGDALSEPIAASARFVGSSDWERFAFDVTIAPDCRGQRLQLEPVESGGGPVFLAGSLWFDNLVLEQYH
jgi:tetratricopeptide (TPR) repeat protein